jgi:hypothetical protein
LSYRPSMYSSCSFGKEIVLGHDSQFVPVVYIQYQTSAFPSNFGATGRGFGRFLPLPLQGFVPWDERASMAEECSQSAQIIYCVSVVGDHAIYGHITYRLL